MIRCSQKTILFVAVLFILVASPIFAEPSDAAAEKIANSYFAINGTKIFHVPDQADLLQQRADWMHELGVYWDRSDWWWHKIEPEKGRFDFSLPDHVVAFMKKNEIQVLPILNYGAAWFPQGKTGPTTEEEREAFGEYVYQNVKRYRDTFTYWEVWNEPNILPFWAPEPKADDYAALLKVAYEAAKRADPDCKICAPVIAPVGPFDRKFVERLYQLGCKDYFDVFDYHYYRNHPPEEEVQAELIEIKALMHRYGDDKPIWISETGVSGLLKDAPASYEKQASLVVRNQLLCIASGVERIFYFDLQNWNDNIDTSWDGQLGLVEMNGKRKPSFFAYKTLVEQVDFKRVLGRWRQTNGSLESVHFYDEKTDDYMMAIWTTSEKSRDVYIPCRGKEARLVQPYGKEMTLPITQGVVKFTVDEHPRYLHSVDPVAYLPDIGITMNPQKIEITPGDRQPLKITRDPLLKNCEIEVLEVKQPNGILWHHESGVIEVEKDCRPGNKMLKVRLKVKCTIDGKAVTRYMRKPVQIEVFPTLSLGLRPYMQEGAFKVRGRVENLSNREVSGALQLNENVNGKLKVLGKKRLGSIEPGQQVESLFPVDVKELLKINQPVSWQLSFQNTESRPFRIAPATFRKTVPKIDGQLDEWACLPFIAVGDSSQIIRNVGQWTPDSASAKVYLWMTPDSLCLAADVTDNDPIKNDNKPVEIWKGDNLELYIGLAGPATRTILDKSVDFQVGFAPTCAEGRPIVFLFHKDVILESAEIVVKETKTGYILEARVPLKELGEFEMNPGMLLGFDIGLDDIDSGDFALEGTNAGRQLMWNGSGSNWINPSGWGMAILQQK